MAESPVGRPGGGSRTPSAATAATFQVSDASLHQMLKVWKDLTKEVGNFNAELVKLSKGGKAVDDLAKKLGGLGVGGANLGGSDRATGGAKHADYTRAGSGRAPNGGDSGFSGQGQEGDGPNALGRWWNSRSRGSQIAIGGAITGYVSAGSYYQRHMQSISDADLFFNQQGQMAGMGYSRGAFNNARVATQRTGGYQSTQDLLAGTQSVLGAVGGTVTSARTQGVLQSFGQLSTLNPGGGLQGSAAVAQNLYAPRTSYALRAIGAGGSIGAGGQLRTPQDIYNAVLKIVYHGRRPTPQMITEGMQPGAPLYVTLTALGLDANTQNQFMLYALAQANLGGDTARTNRALADYAAGRQTKDTGKLGLNDSIRQQQNKLGRRQSQQEIEAGVQGKDTLQTGFDALAGATNKVTEGFQLLSKATFGLSGPAMASSTFLGGSLTQAVGHMGGVGGLAFNISSTLALGHKIMGNHGGITGRGLGAAGAAGRAGTLASLGSTALGMSGALGTPVFVTNWPAGGFGGGGGGGILGDIPWGGGPEHGPHPQGRMGRWGARLGGRGALRVAGRALGLAGLGLVAGDVADWAGRKTGHHGTGTLAGDTLRGAGVGAAIGSVVPVIGTGVGAAVGAGVGALWAERKNLTHWAKKWAHSPWWHESKKKSGDPHHDAPPVYSEYMRSMFDPTQAMGDGPGGEAAQRGPSTISDIEALAHGGPAFRVSSTYRANAHTTSGRLSYHATKNAVDFAAPKPSKDSPGLLAINKYFASRYGRGLKELIYSGPGGVNLLNGFPHVFDKQVRDLHHDHVHVAATKESLKSVGGVSGGGGVTSPGGQSTASSTSPTASGVTAGSPGIFADEASAFASILNQGFGGSSIAAPAAFNRSSPATGHAGGSGAPIPPAGSGGSQSANVALGKSMAAARGWTGSEWDALYQLWMGESGWRNTAQNPTSSAYGIAQFLDSTWGHRKKTSDPATQIKYGMDYIASRYHDPVNALRKWESRHPHWYEKGAWETDDELARLHRGEMVVPAAQARKMRQMVRDRGRNVQHPAGVFAAAGSGPREVKVTIHAPITLAGKATPQDARDFLSTIKRVAEEDATLAQIGGP